MSLLLEARKKSLQAPPPASPASGTEQVTQLDTEEARNAGQNLFAAKSPLAHDGAAPARLLLALGGMMLLIGGTAAYWWYGNSARNAAPRPVGTTPAVIPAPPVMPSVEPPPTEVSQETPVVPAKVSPPLPQTRESADTVRIERPHPEQVDPKLNAAYEAYRSGKLDEAQQLYLALYRKDTGNIDALLGLAAIAQQRGEPEAAAEHYARALVIDPRNAAANAGMSALNEDDDNNETRLKLLLREQGNAAVLHFALGNLYAGQSRWGEAQQAYFNAVALEPDNAEFAYNLAVSLDHLGQAGPAAQHYKRALELDPSHSAGFDHAQVSRRIAALSK